MGRKLATLILPAVVGCYSSAALALGLGGIEADSSLNEPLSARIPLISATEAELENLRISLGSPEAFERAGVSRPFFLNRLRFELITDGGEPYIQVTTADPVKEPFLDFLMEARWPQGQLLREYTILVDPPLYASEPAAPATRAPASGSVADAGVDGGGGGGASTAAAALDAPSGVRETAAEPTSGGGETMYGPVSASDTLWEIADGVRPGDVTVNQAMLALLRTNPDAFIENNINRLRRGAILRVPGRDEMTRLDVAEAIAEVSAQIERWQSARNIASAPPVDDPSPSADSAAVPEPGSDSAADGEARSQLTVVAPQDSTGLDATASLEEQGGAAPAAVDSRLTMLEETNASLESENDDLSAQVESLKRDLARLESMINLQMQESVPGADAAAESGAVTDPVTTDQATAETGMADATSEFAEATAAESTGDAAEMAPVVAEAQPEPRPATATPPTGSQAAATATADTESAAAPEPVQGPDVMALLMQNAQLIAAGGGAVLLLLLVLVMMRRRRAADSVDDLEPMPAPAAAAAVAVPASAAASGGDDDHDDHEQDDFAGQPARSASSGEASRHGDLLEQAEVFIALGNLEKAQSVLDEALGEDPDNRDLRFKLLEVLAERDDRGGFEAEAQVFHTQVDPASDPRWSEVVRMGRQIAPEHPLFGDAGENPANLETPANQPVESMVDATAFDLDLDEKRTSADEKREFAGDTGEFDLDFDLEDEPATPVQARTDSPASGFDSLRPMHAADRDDGDDGTDFDLDFVLDETDWPRETANTDSVRDRAASDDSGLDFELPADLETDNAADRKDTVGSAVEDDDTVLDFGDPEMTRPVEGEPARAASAADEDFDLDALDEAGTKLDLARAYIDMGDGDGARSLLEEVMVEGDRGQKHEAEYLLKRAG